MTTEQDSGEHELDPRLSLDRVRAHYTCMLRARVVDDRLTKLSEEGRIGFFPSGRGREAAIVGTLAALREGDWIFPTQGDHAVAVQRDVPLDAMFARVFATASDPLVGHDISAGFADRRRRIASISAPAATHLPHAVGVAYAARLRGRDVLTAALFDAREIDAADFHTGLNFAGVMKTPTLFVCRRAADEESAADHAVAYGLSSASCDGSDLLAVVRTVRSAFEQAVVGRGATVIDLVIGGPEDAIDQTRDYLVDLGGWTDEEENAVRDRMNTALDAAVSTAELAPPPEVGTMFDHVFSKLTPHLRAQRDELLSSSD